MFSDGDGEVAVRLARTTVDGRFNGHRYGGDIPQGLEAMGGCFVTLNTHPARELRGCIGFVDAKFPLHQALALAAEAACDDPRFPPLGRHEVDGVVVEVSLLSSPEALQVKDPLEYPRRVEVGKHGLIVTQGRYTGLLLPQVPGEWGWDAEEFLTQSCMKAGLLPDAWFDPTTTISCFTADVFGEVEPRGRVLRRPLGVGHEGRRG